MPGIIAHESETSSPSVRPVATIAVGLALVLGLGRALAGGAALGFVGAFLAVATGLPNYHGTSGPVGFMVMLAAALLGLGLAIIARAKPKRSASAAQKGGPSSS